MAFDDRVSKFQMSIYNWLRELYPFFKIEMEKIIPKSNQRIDIYIHQLNTAIECDGEFHDKPTGFFVKTEEQWKDIIQRDKAKASDLEKHGIRLIRIPYKHKLKSSADLEKYMEDFPYPSKELDESLFINHKKEKVLSQQKEYNKLRYEESKDKYKEQQRERRKEAYQKMKELRKASKKP